MMWYDESANISRRLTSVLKFCVFYFSVQGMIDGTLQSARFGFPMYLAVDNAGNLYMNDQYNNNYYSVRKLSPRYGNVTTMAGKTCTYLSDVMMCY